jgi:predicted ATPase
VELLEREGALATLADAREAAARGAGRVVFVTGEPGIGKTTLVTRFLRGLGADARVLLGTCDDLSIARPLGPIRDLVGNVSPPLERAVRRRRAARASHAAGGGARAAAAADRARARGRVGLAAVSVIRGLL